MRRVIAGEIPLIDEEGEGGAGVFHEKLFSFQPGGPFAVCSDV